MYGDMQIDKEKMFRDKDKMFTTDNKKFKIIILILGIVLLFLIVFVCYDKFYLDKNMKNEIATLNKRYEETDSELKKQRENNVAFETQIKSLESELGSKSKLEKNYIISNSSPYISGFEDVHIYAVIYRGAVFAQDGKMYVENSFGSNGELNFEYSRSDEDIYNPKINEKDVLKVKMFHSPTSNNEDNVAYFIYKNGRVKEIERGESIKDRFVFEGYKVKDIKIECGKRDKYSKKCTGEYVLTLKNGTIKRLAKVS